MLTIRRLVKVYPGPVTALEGIELDVPRGMFGLLGPNGAGKSTLMKILAGLLEPTSGEVSLDDHDILHDPAYVRARLGYLPQDFGFYPNLSGERMLEYLLRLKGVEAPAGIRRLVADLLERVNLSFAAKRRLKGYSGGMRQRLGIAQAIAGDPSLLIVDEPTAGLDPEERHRFYRLLAELAADRTVLLSTHIVEDVSELCTRMAIIDRGEILLETEPLRAMESLRGRIWRAVIAKGALSELERTHSVISTKLLAGRTVARVHSQIAPGSGFEPVEPELQDVYFSAMNGRRRELEPTP
jgi:ABC-type multidrug transport system ATPase subunit